MQDSATKDTTDAGGEVLNSRILLFLAVNIIAVILALAATSYLLLRYRSAWRKASEEVTRLRSKLVDWPEMNQFRAANAALQAPQVSTPRVVFLGDSITRRWDLQKMLPEYEAVNRGIGWQTTSEMLARIRGDAIDLQPSAIVILGGSNDFHAQCGPFQLATTKNNIRSMVELARQSGIAIIVGTLTPFCEQRIKIGEPSQYGPHSREEFNKWLRTYCDGERCEIADFDAAMIGSACEYMQDASHPNELGYRVMNRVVHGSLNRLKLNSAVEVMRQLNP